MNYDCQFDYFWLGYKKDKLRHILSFTECDEQEVSNKFFIQLFSFPYKRMYKRIKTLFNLFHHNGFIYHTKYKSSGAILNTN